MSATDSGSNGTPDRGDFYGVLGIAYGATPDEINRAYREKIKHSHPDRHQPERRHAAEERAKLLNLAFATLSKPESRQQYDRTLKQQAVQDQIMSRYVGGMAPGQAGVDPLGEAMRRERTAYERSEGRLANRSAMLSIAYVFGAITLLLLAVLVVWAVVSSLAGAVL